MLQTARKVSQKKQREEFFELADGVSTYYIALSKEIGIKNSYNYAIKLKLPETGVFANINTLQRQAIELEVQNAMKAGYLFFNSNVLAEIAGYHKLFLLIDQLANGTYNADIFDANGFESIPYSESQIIKKTSS